jgi:RTX calcium-binding nonapeptide repeat (4 copies)
MNSFSIPDDASLSIFSEPAPAFSVVQNNDPTQLLNALLSSDPTNYKGLSNFDLQLVGDGRAFGTFTNDPFGLGSAVAMSTGQVRDLAGVNSVDGSTVAGTPDLSTDLGLSGNSGDSIDLILSFDVDNTVDRLYFQYVFGSEELLEFGGSAFNDSFSLFLNGTNYARLNNGATVSINNLAGSPTGPFSPDLVYNPVGTGSASNVTKLDAYTVPLLYNAPLIQNQRNTLVINIQDVSDGIYDSGVFLKAGTLGSVNPNPPDPNSNNQINLDVDGSGAATFSRDGLLISAFLFFNRSDRTDYSVLNKFILDPAATRKTGDEIANYIKDGGGLDALDVDGSGTTSFARDGLLISAFLFFNRSDRTDYSVLDKFILDPAATRRTGNDVANYLKGLLPSTPSAGLVADKNDIAFSSEILGTVGNDTLTGDTGNNILVGDAGNDLLAGSLGADTCQFAVNSGNDIITDFSVAQDLISIDSTLGFSNSSEIFAALTSKGMVDDRLSSELNLGANGTISILHDGVLTVDNFVVI